MTFLCPFVSDLLIDYVLVDMERAINYHDVQENKWVWKSK